MIPHFEQYFYFKSVQGTLPPIQSKTGSEPGIVITFVKCHILGLALEVWKNFGENIRKQGREATRHHRIREKRHQEEEKIYQSQAIEGLIRRQVRAFRHFQNGNLNNRHLHLPI